MPRATRHKFFPRLVGYGQIMSISGDRPRSPFAAITAQCESDASPHFGKESSRPTLNNLNAASQHTATHMPLIAYGTMRTLTTHIVTSIMASQTTHNTAPFESSASLIQTCCRKHHKRASAVLTLALEPAERIITHQNKTKASNCATSMTHAYTSFSPSPGRKSLAKDAARQQLPPSIRSSMLLKTCGKQYADNTFSKSQTLCSKTLITSCMH